MLSYLVILVQALVVYQLVVSLDYNETCSLQITKTKGECNFQKGLSCNRSLLRCRCRNETEMEYPDVPDRCEVFVHGNCLVDKTKTYLECRDFNAACSSKNSTEFKCHCQSGTLPTDENKIGPEVKCLAVYPGYRCHRVTQPCHSSTKMICSFGLCRCPINQGFSYAQSKCVTGLGIPDSCDPAKGSEQCIDNAHCKENKCQCRPGYSITFEYPRRCLLDYGQICNKYGQSGNDDVCNWHRGLKCIKGACSCEPNPDVVYDQEAQACAAREGAPCSPGRSPKTTASLPCMRGHICFPKILIGENPTLGPEICIAF